VDVELVRPMADALALSERFFSAAERRALRAAQVAARDAAFFSCWTRKEAYIKAIGEGLSCPLDSFDVSVAPAAPRLLQVGGSTEAAAGWTIAVLDLPTGVIGAVAVEAREIRVWNAGAAVPPAVASRSPVRPVCRELA
jgi:4'-phosphopantetheinyl transferase